MASSTSAAVKLFVSYSHDSDAHKLLVREFVHSLRQDGFIVVFDQDMGGQPPDEGWPKWMAVQLAEATIVLVVCTARSFRITLGQEVLGRGHGIAFETTLTFQEIYDGGTTNRKFIPVLLAGGRYEDIPVIMRPWWNDYVIGDGDGYARLCTRLRAMSVDPNPRTSEEIPSSSVYVTSQISELVLKYLNEAGLAVYDLPFDWDLTVDDLVHYCSSVAADLSNETIRALVQNARAFAFDAKYSNNTYENNSRGIGDYWKREIRDVLTVLDAPDYLNRPIIDVGIGNGIEAPGLLDGARNLTAVDIAPQSLAKAETLMPRARFVAAAAENLIGVKTASQDVYISCRTYQSSYFGVSEALREAYRVVRPGGLVLVSVANGYVGEAGGLIPGMLIPRSNTVSRDRPFEVADKIRRKLTLLRFEGIGIRTGVAEVYVYGRRGR